MKMFVFVNQTGRHGADKGLHVEISVKAETESQARGKIVAALLEEAEEGDSSAGAEFGVGIGEAVIHFVMRDIFLEDECVLELVDEE